MLRTGLLTIIVGFTALCVVTGCAVAPTPSSTPTLPATSTPEPTPASSPTPFPPCDSSQFMVPTSVITSGKLIDYLTGLPAPTPQSRGLSVRLDDISTSVQYFEAIPVRLSITNERNVPIIFPRPQGLSFNGDFGIAKNSIIVDLRTASGDRISSEEGSMADQLVVYAPPANEFSMLPAGAGCRIDTSLVWDKMNYPLYAPIPSGDYQAKARLYLWDRGPAAGDNTPDYVDIGAWMGLTDYSNAVTFTILPPEK